MNLFLKSPEENLIAQKNNTNTKHMNLLYKNSSGLSLGKAIKLTELAFCAVDSKYTGMPRTK